MFGKLFDKLFGKGKQEEEKEEDFLEEEEEYEEDEEYDEEDDDYDEDEEYEEEEVSFLEFRRTFGDVTVETVNNEYKGICLEATWAGTKIIMEHYENHLLDFPDGSNGYFFGNKLIIVTRWSGMSDAEKRKVETAELALALHPYPCVQLSLKVGENWGDVLVNLHHCWAALNDENAPVDEAILFFADTADPEYLTCRTVALPPFVKKFLQKCNVSSHKFLDLDSKAQDLQLQYARDPAMDFYNKLYDAGWAKSRKFYNQARATDLEDIPDGVYLEISAANKVTKFYQND